MELITYQTNISSEAILEKLKPLLDQTIGSGNWGIDLKSKEKTLRVFAPDTINENALMSVFRQAGVSATNIDDYYSIY
ncbi:MAG TPA: hypothetical protein VK166_03250 [Chitinophagaceae bacterium]|nr:hypothetical protein [Chitinophagaceae bacterium]